MSVGIAMRRISIPEAGGPEFCAGKRIWRSHRRFGIRYAADVTEPKKIEDAQQRVGLCFDCLHSQRIQSPRGSTFYRCKLSDTDPNFAIYPRLRVLQCAGYTRRA